jgi:hypothetical protein
MLRDLIPYVHIFVLNTYKNRAWREKPKNKNTTEKKKKKSIRIIFFVAILLLLLIFVNLA